MSIHEPDEALVVAMAAAYKEIIEAKDRLIEQLLEDKDTLLHQRARNLGELAQLRMVMELTGWDKGRPW